MAQQQRGFGDGGRNACGVRGGVSTEESRPTASGNAAKTGRPVLSRFGLEAKGGGRPFFVVESHQLKSRLIGSQRAQELVIDGMT